MQDRKKVATFICAVLRGMLFIGFSIQIVLGVCWLCRNFGHVQGFGEPDSRWYGAVLAFFRGNSGVMYLLQLCAAFGVGTLFLQKLWPVGILSALWRGLALLTVPFALQCHLALQPYSFMSSLFLLMILCLLCVDRRKWAALFAGACVCGALLGGFSGVADRDRISAPGYSFEGAMASRFAWPTLWNDLERYGEEVTAITRDVAWEASLYPDNIRLFQEVLEGQMGEERVRETYLQMARVGWECHAPMIKRQIGWDILGYMVTPVIFQMQMRGRAYDSYSGRNYEIMREKAPILTRNYVDYGCWWFVCAIVFGVLLNIMSGLAGGAQESGAESRRSRKRLLAGAGISLFLSVLLTVLLTMRGAGRMDYRYTIAVNELWLVGSLFAMGGKRQERK